MELACSVHNGMEQYQLLAGFRTDASIPLLKREYTSSDVSHSEEREFRENEKMSVEERSAFIRRQLSRLSHEDIDNEKA